MNKRIVIPMSVTLAVGVILLGSLLHREQNQLTDAQEEIVVLGENLASLGIVLAEETSTRELAEQEVASLQNRNLTLSRTISSLEGNIATLETALAEEISMRKLAEQEVASLQNLNLTLSDTISSLRRDIVTLETALELAQAEVVTLSHTISSLRGDIVRLETALAAVSDRLRKMQYAQHFASVAQLTNWLREDDTNTKDDSPMQLALVLQRRALMDGFLLPVALYWHENKLWIINIAVVGRNIYGINAENDSIEFKFFPDAVPPLLP